MKKEIQKITIYRIISIILLIVIAITFAYKFISARAEQETLDTAIKTLNNAVSNTDVKYISLEIGNDVEAYDYSLQVYNENKNYYIYNSKTSDESFTVESYCDFGNEYLKTDFTYGYEILGTTNCNNRDYNISFGFSGFDLSNLDLSDFDVSKKSGKTILKLRKDKLSAKLFLGDFLSEDDLVENFTVTVEEGSVSTASEVVHPIHGKMKIKLDVKEGVVLATPNLDK